MDEPTRLVCPECELVYRVKRFRSGKLYVCKNCGESLRSMDGTIPPGMVGGLDPDRATEEKPETPDFHRHEARQAKSGVNGEMLREILRLAQQLDEDGKGTRDELIKEQNAVAARIDHLAGEIKQSIHSVERLQEWRNELPVQVADEIGRTVEERMVAPISIALARQAPAILSEIQDNKLVDIVSRSVREAQRPLLREILVGGRGGVPVWLFASILLPLLLIIGYLFMPGDTAMVDNMQAMNAVADNLARGVPMTVDAEERLRTIEDVVLDLHGEALAHVKNAAALEEEMKSVRATLAERDALIKDYSETLQKQVRRLRAYELRLTRLGVASDSITE